MLLLFLVRSAFNAIALWVAVRLLDGLTVTGDKRWLTFIVAGIVFSAVNMLVKPLVTLLALPLIVLTLGIAYFLVNVAMLFLTSALVDDFHIDGFWWGVAAALIVWLVNAALGALSRNLQH
jgi:putative membrane protein